MSQTTQGTILINAKELGQRLSLSKRQIFRLNSCEKIPAPLRIGGSIRWNQSDVDQWIDIGCPDRNIFEARKAGQK